MRLLRALALSTLITPSLAAVAVPVARAQSQPSAERGLATVDLLAAQAETQVATLARARDLNTDAMVRLALELEYHVNVLTDHAAPFQPLAALVPEIRVKLASLVHNAILGTASDVESDADDLVRQIRELRVRARNLRAGAPVIEP